MKKTSLAVSAVALALSAQLAPTAAEAQSFPTDDPVIRQMWAEGMEGGSQAYELAQTLLDSIGPRLTGSTRYEAAADWIMSRYEDWGVDVEKHEYGTWRGWERGVTHIDLVSPRVRTLRGTLLAWSGGTDGPVEADVVAFPTFSSAAEFEAWLPEARGKLISLSFPEPTCRAPESWEQHATPASWERMQSERAADELAWNRSLLAASGQAQGSAGGLEDEIAQRLEAAGAAGVFRANWSNGWGADKIFDSSTTEMPSVHLDCEDYGLVTRLAQNGQSPRVRLEADVEFTGEVPAFSVVGTIPGTQLPDEYVLLSAHLDSWDGASGATDNGTGTIMMLEAMRILKATYPNPRRTIIVGHWGAEEQGLNGSRAFVEDNPDVIDGLQAAFNQDNGAWRVDFIRMQGFTGAGEHFGRWFSSMPSEITDHIELDSPSVPEGIPLPGRERRRIAGGSDHMAFTCLPVPAFRFQSNYPDYRQYTWHTGIDTFDKLIFDDLRNNATLAAMVAYQASEDPERISHDTRMLPVDERTGQPYEWPSCGTARRSYGG
jgi:hypothetical protein